MFGGYDACFIQPLGEDNACPICTFAVRDPVQTLCGHPFCNACLQRTFRGNTLTCPVCRTELFSSQIYPNKLQERQVLSLKIKCDRHRKGCEWIGELREREHHTGACQYVRKPCGRHCGKLVMRKDAVEHDERKCSRRTVECVHCHHNVQVRYFKIHSRKCWEMAVSCERCGSVLPRKEMRQHACRQGSCHIGTVKCEFEEFGCEFEGNQQNIREHLEGGVAAHLSKLVVVVKKQRLVIDKQKESQEKQKVAMQHRLSRAESQISDQQRELDGLKQQLGAISQQLATVRQASVPSPVVIRHHPPHHFHPRPVFHHPQHFHPPPHRWAHGYHQPPGSARPCCHGPRHSYPPGMDHS